MVAEEEDVGACVLRFILTYQRKHCAAEALAELFVCERESVCECVWGGGGGRGRGGGGGAGGGSESESGGSE